MAAAIEASSSASASVATTEAKKILLKSSDNVEFEVEESVALQSQTIKHMIENGCTDSAIPLANVTGDILDLVIEYCKKHTSADMTSASADELKKWDAQFVNIDRDALSDLMLAAKYLNIEGLMGLIYQTAADMMKGKTLIHSNQNLKPSKKIMLKSSDDVVFEVEEAVAVQSQTIKHMIEDGCADNVIPLPNITGEILDLVIEYCEKHVENGDKRKISSDTYTPSYDTSPDDELKKWDAEFVNVDQDALFDVMLAANYLNIKGLLDLTCQTVADMMRGKTPEEIRKTFNIINDYTPEEEAELRSSMQWAFE